MSESPKKSPAPSQKMPSEIPIHFLKTGGFRVVHADGAWLSANASGCFFLTFYSEHPSLPNKVIAKLDEQGTAVSEDVSRREALDGMTRDVEVEIALTIPAATQLWGLLGHNLQSLQAAFQKEQAEGKK